MRGVLAATALVTACSYDRPARLGADAPSAQGDAPVGACAVNNGGCDTNATCRLQGSSPVCTCKAGFIGDGATCQEIWTHVQTIAGIKLVDGYEPNVTASGTNIYFAPDNGATGTYFKSINTQGGQLTDLPLPPVHGSQNEFCACGGNAVFVPIENFSRIYLFGNWGSSFSTSTNSWTDITAQYPPSNQRNSKLAISSNDRVYIFAGGAADEYFNPGTGQWTVETYSLPGGYVNSTAVVVGSVVYVVGNDSGYNKTYKRDLSNTVGWQALADSPAGLGLFAAVFGTKIVSPQYGGLGDRPMCVYDIPANTWSCELEPPMGLENVALVRTSTGTYLLGDTTAPSVELYKLNALP